MQYLTMTQLRAKLGDRGRTTIYEDMKRGHLPKGIKIGTKLYWIEEEIDAAVAKLAADQGVQPVAELATQ